MKTTANKAQMAGLRRNAREYVQRAREAMNAGDVDLALAMVACVHVIREATRA